MENKHKSVGKQAMTIKLQKKNNLQDRPKAAKITKIIVKGKKK